MDKSLMRHRPATVLDLVAVLSGGRSTLPAAVYREALVQLATSEAWTIDADGRALAVWGVLPGDGFPAIAWFMAGRGLGQRAGRAALQARSVLAAAARRRPMGIVASVVTAEGRRIAKVLGFAPCEGPEGFDVWRFIDGGRIGEASARAAGAAAGARSGETQPRTDRSRAARGGRRRARRARLHGCGPDGRRERRADAADPRRLRPASSSQAVRVRRSRAHAGGR